ncbi:unnamed protein product [Linum trigynum]|uniref:Uncharacterized protein n=1 Tax=Linum trigynum TaxID=586398 RepID=A0AAV2E465_9ROSI
MMITLKDIAILTNLPINGDVVCTDFHAPDKVGNMSGWQHLIWTATRLTVPEKGEHDEEGHPPYTKGQCSITWLIAAIKRKHNPDDESIPLTAESLNVDKEIYARVYLIGMISGVFFPKKNPTT